MWNMYFHVSHGISYKAPRHSIPSRWYINNTNLCILYELGSNYSMGFIMYPHPTNL